MSKGRLKVASISGVTMVAGYTAHIDIRPDVNRVTAFAPDEIIANNVYGLGFNAANEVAYFAFEVHHDWDGASDFNLGVIWYPESGDVIQDTEDVVWSIDWRSITSGSTGGDPINQGTVETDTVTYTQSGAGTDMMLIESDITMAYTGGNQEIAAGDWVFIAFSRAVGSESNSYTGNAVVIDWEISYTSEDMPYH